MCLRDVSRERNRADRRGVGPEFYGALPLSYGVHAASAKGTPAGLEPATSGSIKHGLRPGSRPARRTAAKTLAPAAFTFGAYPDPKPRPPVRPILRRTKIPPGQRDLSRRRAPERTAPVRSPGGRGPRRASTTLGFQPRQVHALTRRSLGPACRPGLDVLTSPTRQRGTSSPAPEPRVAEAARASSSITSRRCTKTLRGNPEKRTYGEPVPVPASEP